MTTPVHILIADSLRLFGDCLASSLSGQDGLAVVGQATNAPDALRMTASLQPDMVLVGTSLGKKAALTLTSEISLRHPQSKVIVLGILEAEQTVIEFIEAGASGYTLKQSPLEDLLRAIEVVRCGEATCSARLAYSMFERIGQLSRPGLPDRETLSSGLSAREEEILRLIADGLSNKRIAERLFISPSTVKNHVHNILEKLKVPSRAEAVNCVLGRERPIALARGG